ncbi:MAG: 1-deoxy-D-xylulose-5-phosphate reductoisomerase [Pseudomonadales bacterium]|nr:1-deoxy-D-xylulose-5-phosphate reductoisomerase [Pseudomonadales bacterium]
MQNVTILGATGSIGLSTLDVLNRHTEHYCVYALTAHSRMVELAQLCHRYKPQRVVVAHAGQIAELTKLGVLADILVGEAGLVEVSVDPEVQVVMAAIVGAAGLMPTLAAVQAGKRVLLANKEALVMTGELFMHAAREHKAILLPVDSEHNAIFQCMDRPGVSVHEQGINCLILTASGGPFRDMTWEDMERATPAMAIKHPRWSMGPKISVDSATLMNKGLELIEACWLFAVRPDQVQIVIHPESIIHSMVQYRDGSTLAQLGRPDMRTPIAQALAWPERIQAGVEPLDILACGGMHFQTPDETRFPCLRLARQAMAAGGTAPAIVNAANEVAVAAFLQNDTSFTSIPAIIAGTLDRIAVQPAHQLQVVLDADRQARAIARELVPRFEVET